MDGKEIGDAFLNIIKEHRVKYPLMRPQDYGKLIFQSEFGPEHLIPDKMAAKRYLLEEWEKMKRMGRLETLPPDRYRYGALQLAEEIGGGICRFPLSACPSAGAAELLAELFAMTAQKPGKAQKKRAEGIRAKVKSLDVFGIPGMEQWAASWMEQGCPPVHHSDIYREAYQPHYRLLRKEYAGYFPVLLKIQRLLEKRAQEGNWEEGQKDGKKNLPAVIAIDGRCGSGKTGLAELISGLFSCHMLHMDDYYLPAAKRPADWMRIPGGNIDFERFHTEALLPAASGERVFYRPYCCSTGTFQGTEELLPRQLFVVEGSYSHHPFLTDAYDQKIFLTCTTSKQRERLKKRGKDSFHAFEERWIPMEKNYQKYYGIEQGSDFIIDTSEFFESDLMYP